MKKFVLIGFLLFSFLTEAQSAMNENKMSLNKKFSVEVLKVYQDNSKSKVKDLFSYFQLLTDSNINNELKTEIIKNINLLYNAKNEIVVDFASSNLEKIRLQDFIQKLMNSKPIVFTISEESNYNSVDYNFWKTDYLVSTTINGKTLNAPISQKIFFIEIDKKFGSMHKSVYETILGEME